VRLSALVVLTVLGAACAPQPDPPSPAATATIRAVDPARIGRVRETLPPGYEVKPYAGVPTPLAVWGFVGPVEADPPQCLADAAPPVHADSAQGWSASGPGGIVYAVVAAAENDTFAGRGDCPLWTVSAGHTTGTVTGVPAPPVAAAETAGMATAATTVVEGGTETRAEADTYVAHLGRFVCFVAVVTDPGSPYAPLDAAFAADLLTETVSTLRG
jgi:hypothetical protein